VPKFLANVDLAKNQLLQARVENLASAPSSPVSGQIYYDTGTSKMYYWNGAWIPMDGSAAITYGSPSASAVGDTSSDGVATTVARSDHRHAREAFGAVTAQTTFGAASGNGSASSVARSDHTHGTPAHTAAIHQELIGLVDLTDVSSATITSGMVLISNGTTYAATDFDTRVRTSRLDQMAAPTASVSMNSQKITNLLDPTNPQDAATKFYVDAARSGLDVKQSVRAASTANVTVTYSATGGTSARGQITAAPNTLDGVTLAANDRILLKDQSTGAQNGIWVVTTLGTGANGVWDRATDFDADAEVTSGAFTFVTEGTTNDNTGWVLTTNDPITIGGASGTALAWTKFSDSAAITAGAGLTQTGNTFDVVGTTNRITVNANDIDIAATYVGQTSITTLGTVTTGTWSATAIAVDKGGTGLTSYAVGDLIYASGATTLAKLADVAVGNVLISGGVTTAPAWGKVQLSGGTTHINGTLGLANGGTGGTDATTARASLGAVGKYTSAANPNATTWTVNHALNTTAVIVMVYETSSKDVVYPDIDITDANNVTVTFAVAPASNTLTAVVVG
jgi:hypothetical protein